MRKTIGFSRFLRWEWMEHAAFLGMSGASADDAEAALDHLLANQVAEGSQSKRSARAKAISVLLHVWFPKNPKLIEFRRDALTLYRDTEPASRLALHWGMALTNYPFFVSFATNTGRLIRLQGYFLLGQLERRLEEEYGQRSTLPFAVQKAVQTVVDWKTLKRDRVVGKYRAAESQLVSDPKLVVWLAEALLRSNDRSSLDWRDLAHHPALFPFVFSRPSERSLRGHPRLSLSYQGVDRALLHLKEGNES